MAGFEIDHVRYDHDIIIHTNRSVSKRSKKKSKKLKNGYGHTPLAEHELSFLSDEQPSVIYIGTGQYRGPAYYYRIPQYTPAFRDIYPAHTGDSHPD